MNVKALLVASIVVLSSLGLGHSSVKAQSTFSSVRSIFDTYCTPTCHTVSNPVGSLVLEGSDSDVYNALVMKQPKNSVALAKGDVLVKPGYPEKSFILRKLNKAGWESHPDQILDTGEGDPMPQAFGSLKDEEIELIRQWILFGCPDTGRVVDPQVLYDYYNGNGAARVAKPATPDTSLGFQIRFGPFFVAQSSELEYNIKYSLLNSNTLYVDRLDIAIQPQMHHFIIEKFLGSSGAQFPEGFRPAIIDTSGASTSMVVSVPFSKSFQMPEGAAYFWDPGTDLDLNGHVANVSPDSVLAIEAYTNVYYDPPDSNVTQMYSVLAHYAHVFDTTDFFIPPGENVMFTDSIMDTSANVAIDIWMLTSHTHKYGLSYNIYRRDPCGGKGEILYNGNYDQDYVFDQGYFDYSHPPLRLFDVLPRVPIKYGLIHEATFYNYGTDTVYFGLTTKDEMMNIFIQYTLSPTLVPNEELDCDDTLSVGVLNELDGGIQIYPNPFNNSVSITVPEHAKGSEVKYVLVDILGRVVLNGQERSAFSEVKVDVPDALSAGQYIFSIEVDGQLYRRLIQKR